MRHHEVFSRFKCWNGNNRSSYVVNFLGVRTNKDYICPIDFNQCSGNNAIEEKDEYVCTEYPQFSEGYFEWISVLTSVIKAKNSYTIIELGAGWGPHLVNAAAAVRLLHGQEFPFKLIGVEGEETSFIWMQNHLKDNNIDPEKHQLIKAVVNDKGGEVLFEVGFPKGYGSSIITPSRYLLNVIRGMVRFMRRTYKRLRGQQCLATDYWTGAKGLGMYYKKVKAVTLNAILDPLDSVDLIHMDIAGEEYAVLNASEKNIRKKVKRIHIGTHSILQPGIEDRLRGFFTQLGWLCVYDFPGNGERSTPFGVIKFYDGVQVWVNPKMAA